MIVLMTLGYMIIGLILAVMIFFFYHWLGAQIAILRGKWILMKLMWSAFLKDREWRAFTGIFVILFASNEVTDIMMKAAIDSANKKEREGGPTCE